MSKMLTPNEILFGIALVLAQKRSDPATFDRIACEIGEVLARHTGTEVTTDIGDLDPYLRGHDANDDVGMFVGFAPTAETAADGGVFSLFDNDESVESWMSDYGITPGQGEEPTSDVDARVGYLMVIEEDLSPRLKGPYATDEQVLSAARKHRGEDPDGNDGLARLWVTAGGAAIVEGFGWLGDEEETSA